MSVESLSLPENFDEGFVDVVGDFKLNIWVPTEAVGKVIGKKGAVIQHIQRETKSSCSVISSGNVSEGITDTVDEPLWSPIMIIGSPKCALAAHDMIHDIVEEVDDAVVEFTIPYYHMPRQYQSSFHSPSQAIQLLSAEANVRIHLPTREIASHKNRENKTTPNDLIISLEGNVANIFRVIASIADGFRNTHIPQPDSGCRYIGDLDENRKTDKENWRRPKDAQDFETALNYEQIVNVPTSLIGLLLARRDPDYSVMKQIQRGSQTRIQKLQDPVISALKQIKDKDDKNSNTEKSSANNRSNSNDDRSLRIVESFAVRGSSAVNVEMAVSCLLRIVNGDKISIVLAELNRERKRERANRDSHLITKTSNGPDSTSRNNDIEHDGTSGKNPKMVQDEPADDDDEVSLEDNTSPSCDSRMDTKLKKSGKKVNRGKRLGFKKSGKHSEKR